MMKLSLATRIFLGYAVVLFTFGTVSIFSVLELRRSQDEFRLVTQGYFEIRQKAALIQNALKGIKTTTDRIRIEEAPAERKPWLEAARLNFGAPEMGTPGWIAFAQERLQELMALAPESDAAELQALSSLMTELEEGYREYQTLFDEAAVRLSSPPPSNDPEAPEQALDRLQRQEDALTRVIAHILKIVDVRIRTHADDAPQRQRRAHVAIIGLSLLAIAIGVIATAVSARSLRPVQTLIEGVTRIGRGDYTAQLGVRGEDEIAQLARAFDSMARSLKQREEQLQEKQEALLRAEQLAAVGRVSAQITHEVRNPLSSIGLNIELLEEAFSTAKFENEQTAREAQDILASVIREVDRLTEVTEHYLRMARVPKPSLAAEDLNEVLEGVLAFSKEELERAHVEVVRQLDPNAPRAMADESQLRQVFLNLLRNSREAMSGGGQLIVQSRQQNGDVEVVFRDTGKGMAEADLHRVFEPFFSTKEGGTGLGLAVAQQILHAHGGSIDCQSRLGAGTTFTVKLPRA
ncbi:MAG: sensor histidine kinase [Myxococcaceae bacterium]